MSAEMIEKNRDEILKAEIGSLLFNLGKTHIGFWKKYFPNEEQKFSSYKDYYKENNNNESYFGKELEEINPKLKEFIFKEEVEINNEKIKWIEFFKGNASNSDFIKNIFFKGCENINSGIDKGSPKEQLNNSLWISNAFGSYIKDVNKYYFDDKRKCFFIALNEEFKKNKWFNNPNWKEIREFVLKEVKSWYSNLLSDTRFPINDVTLFDQAYMSSTMFKSALAEIIINSSSLEEAKEKYINNPQNIKWSILGIQYDKLALAEKGLKPAHISWYRKASKEVEDKIKEIIEIEYPLGNEIYRDETGIYFLVPESFENTQDLKDKIYDKVREVFSEKFKKDELIYPSFDLTKPSRGIMNLTKLLDDSKKNFLKLEIEIEKDDDDEKEKEKNKDKNKEKEIDKDKENDKEKGNDKIGICQVCKVRFATKDDETLMCDICRERREGRLENWIQNQEGETIWTGEVADENGRIALMTLKFELKEWLNGRMLSSLLVRKENFNEYTEIIKYLINFIKKQLEKDVITNLEITEEDENKIKKFLSLFDYKGIRQPFENNFGKLKKSTNKQNPLVKKLLQQEEWLKHYKFFNKDNKRIIISESASISFDEYTKPCKTCKDHLYKIFAINFTILQIKNLLLERSIGDIWEEFIKNNLSNKSIIDFEKRNIKWDELTDKDIEFLSKLILQFLLRKNPSPARLRRIWESTKNFLEEVKRDILGSITDIRKKENFKNIIQDLPENYLKNMILEKIKDDNKYKKYFSIIDPTPISWQFAIPANKTNEVIEKIQKLYYKHFKYVNGKLPLHIGVVVQDYKKPLYVGIKALRNIRRDIKDWEDIKTEDKVCINCCDDIEKISNNPVDYYSLYETNVNPDYEFLNLPLGKGVKNYNPFEEFIIYPNTIDFEFLDTNSRRNDIYYKNGKRASDLKSNRPYIWEEWTQFKAFKEEFENKPAILHRLVSLIYSKLRDWKNNEDSFKKFMESTFKRENINVTKFGIKDYSFKEMKKFIDMFEYYHTTLKEI
ncbi:CRISPR-associated protein Csx11 [Hydrogenothermus marinus]|uniref:CRISPR-associated Csx11 family protein n=1 Tax=Hydrogenothermus marinus TaxID=133270 RepID=A0A3M0BLA6_9AQUI|nr:CRISPR-associated protein Csx11 [Hydrogenothermus marinus]RMA97947.1 CRISPR-associated Csx11 family protein [Hydrogenothermus marinus]